MKNPFSKKATKEAKPVTPEPPKVLTFEERLPGIERILSDACNRIAEEYDVLLCKAEITWTIDASVISHKVRLGSVPLLGKAPGKP